MKKIFFSVCLCIYFSITAFSQEDITIYHGTSNQSVLFLKEKNATISSWRDSTVFIREKGTQIEIVVLNPDPLHYTYNIKIDEFEIKDESPDISDLLGALNAIPALVPPPAPAPGTPKSFLPGNPAGATGYATYLQTMRLLEADINIAKEAIRQADEPESKSQAFAFSSDAGYRLTQKAIKGIPADRGRFNSKKLLEELNADAQKAVDDISLYTGMNTADSAKLKELLSKALPLLNQQIVSAINEVKKSISAEAVQRYLIPVTDKNQKIRLIVKKKDGDDEKHRMEIDKLICVIIPEYERKVLELIPMASLTYASGVPEYGVKDGFITEQKANGFKFRIGAMLLYNIGSFGKYKEGSWGVGLGYSVPQKNVLGSFSGGLMVSYKHSFRLGIGGGYSSYAFGLKNNLQPKDRLPADIDNIEKIVDYREKLSFFIHFSILGITILKK
ncbi:hypothetical protein [Niastella sp. OAS944]|uniref:hypothetical protein n=1 Tax=Niastella sp. OAS944 TaxID=2664089 RepID=UPI003478D89C|nr:hypothetical protein [Chitinophagaceae bacterium OAS944]